MQQMLVGDDGDVHLLRGRLGGDRRSGSHGAQPRKYSGHEASCKGTGTCAAGRSMSHSKTFSARCPRSSASCGPLSLPCTKSSSSSATSKKTFPKMGNASYSSVTVSRASHVYWPMKGGVVRCDAEVVRWTRVSCSDVHHTTHRSAHAEDPSSLPQASVSVRSRRYRRTSQAPRAAVETGAPS